MANGRLEDLLVPHVKDMSDEELLDMVRNVRKDRRINKRAIAGAEKKRTKQKDKLREALKGMTPEQIKELLK